MKGAIDTAVILITGAITISLAFAGFTVANFSMFNQRVYELKETDALQGERIATTIARVERIPYLEAKLDKLLENRGIDPVKITPITIQNFTPLPTSTTP
jgi:hypothetical protein